MTLWVRKRGRPLLGSGEGGGRLCACEEGIVRRLLLATPPPPPTELRSSCCW